MDIDKILLSIGSFGLYQKLTILLLLLAQTWQAFSYFNTLFMIKTPSTFYCQFHPDSKYVQLTKCPPDCSSFNSLDIKDGYCGKCLNYIVSDLNKTQSFVMEWDLICDRYKYTDWSQTIFMIFVLFGALFFGPLADKFGRLYAFKVSFIGSLIFSIGLPLSESFPVFVVIRCMQGFFAQGLALISLTMCLEIVESKFRPLCGVLVQVFFAIGIISIACVASMLLQWRYLALFSGLFGLSIAPLLFFMIESPRWSISMRRYNEAKSSFASILRLNSYFSKTAVSGESFDNLHKLASKDDLMSYDTNQTALPLVCLMFTGGRYQSFIVAACMTSWCLFGCAYYGLTFASNKLKTSIYVSVAWSGFAELPGYILLPALINRFGRVSSLGTSLLLGGIFCVLISFNYSIDMVGELVLITFAKVFVSMSFAVANVHTSELFPANMRNVAQGFASVTSQIGGALAPAILQLGNSKSGYRSDFLVFGLMLFASVFLVSRLPDTTPSNMKSTDDMSPHMNK